MYLRHRLPFLQQLLVEFPAVAILGPCQRSRLVELLLESLREPPLSEIEAAHKEEV